MDSRSDKMGMRERHYKANNRQVGRFLRRQNLGAPAALDLLRSDSFVFRSLFGQLDPYLGDYLTEITSWSGNYGYLTSRGKEKKMQIKESPLIARESNNATTRCPDSACLTTSNNSVSQEYAKSVFNPKLLTSTSTRCFSHILSPIVKRTHCL